MTMDEQMPKCPSDYLRMVEDGDDWVELDNWVELVPFIAAAAGVLTSLLLVWLPLVAATAITIVGSAVLKKMLVFTPVQNMTYVFGGMSIYRKMS